MAPSEPEYVDGGVVIEVKVRSALAQVRVFRQFFLLDRATAATHLTGIVRIHKDRALYLYA